LRQDPENQVDVINGQKGELTVLVDGREVARKGDSMPSVEEVKAAVKRAEVPAGAR
jgi:hypothetical protein